MRIFIWKSYGDVDVYRADTLESLKKIFDEIIDILDDWGMTDEVTEAKEAVIANTERAHVLAISDLIGEQVGTHETFEYGTAFGTLKE